MQKLQLYISGQRIDLFKDETVSISLSQQNVKDPAKIFTEFTKTFTIPASKTNNLLFSHYYNFNIVNNVNSTLPSFDARNKIESSIELNNIPYKDGFIALNGVELKKNKAYAYKITFYGKTINLTKTFRDSTLSSLQNTLSTYNLIYNNATIVAKMQVDPTATATHIITPLVTHTTEAFYTTASTSIDGNLSPQTGQGLLFSQLKYAIKLSTVVTAIQTTYGLDFSTDFFGDTSNTAFNNLYLWLNAKKGDVEPTTQDNVFEGIVDGFVAPVGQSNETTMVGTSGLSISPLYIPSSVSLDIFTPGGATVAEYTVRITNTQTNQVIFTSPTKTTSSSFSEVDFGTLGVGVYTVTIIGSTAITFQSIKWTLLDTTTIPGFSNEWETASGYNFATVFEFVIGQQMPDIKVIDFMNGLFKLFNLTAYFDNQPLLVNGNTNPNFQKIRIQTLDSFYSTNFNTWDISKFIDVSSSTINVGLPYNSITFNYDGLTTFYAQQFLQTEGSSWGGIRYEGIGTTEQSSSFTAPNLPYNITTPFEHLQFVRLYNNNGGTSPLNVMTGFFADDNKESMVGKAFLFYPIRLTPSDGATEIRIKAVQDASSFTDLTTFIIPSNSLSLNPDVTAGGNTSNINFNNENNEWTDTSQFTGTLFKNYYETYISDVFNFRRRIFNFKAYLPLQIIYKLQMNDVITINNQDFIINSANINLITGESSLELLNKV
jgi:hypothetical protein|tara:strand:+ start:1405 stop:3546 length:2142 start_codon:yes stop_codon:yes gene_type:complete